MPEKTQRTRLASDVVKVSRWSRFLSINVCDFSLLTG